MLASNDRVTHRLSPALWHNKRRNRPSLLIALSFACLSLLSTLGCETKQDPPPTQQIDSLKDRQARRDADALRKNLPALLDALAQARGQKDSGSLVSALEVSAQSQLPASTHPNLPGLRTLYAGQKMQWRWFSTAPPHELSPEGLSWVSTLGEIEQTHGIFDEAFELPTIQQSLATLDEPLPALDVSLDETQQDELTTWFESHASAFEGDSDNARLLEALLAEQGPLSELAPTIAALSEHYARKHEALHRADILLSSALMTYARRMRFQNKAWQRDRLARHKEEDAQNADAQIGASTDEKEATQPTESKAQASPEKLAEQAIRPFFLRETDEAPSLTSLLESLQPPFEQYGRLVRAYQRYQEIVAQGGWSELPESVVGLKVGSSGKGVVLLKERLRAEKMWEGDDSETFDRELEKAVKHYQHTHQIWEKGFVTRETWRSMNIPAYRRMLRIRYSLERWRNLRIGPDEDYIYVNIPDFHAELWSGQNRELRFRVVTGSARKEWNPKTRKHERPLATKLFSDTMEYVVFNPYWNVPKGIVEGEITPKLEENPDYLEENFYEWHDLPSGNRIMRQTPGEHNALGLVKFLFPNDHNIYLHDTNQKGFFDYPIRAFSHGCIRVQEPMKLAEALLKRDGQWSADMIARHTKPGGGESWISLKKPLPVHIEYVVVRVDDEGHAHFLADIYNLEAKPMTDISARERAYGVAGLARSLSSAKQDKVALNQ